MYLKAAWRVINDGASSDIENADAASGQAQQTPDRANPEATAVEVQLGLQRQRLHLAGRVAQGGAALPQAAGRLEQTGLTDWPAEDMSALAELVVA